MRKKLFLVLSCVLFISGCATTPSFQEANDSSPHAILNFQGSTDFWSKKAVGAMTADQINGKSPSFWKLTNSHFNVPSGHYSILVSICQIPRYGYTASAMVDIDVEAGHTYDFTREVHDDNSISLKATRDDGQVVYQGTMSEDPGYCPPG